jgi:SAM-dependent methyltransferase
VLRNGERQVAPDISGIRRDHAARYEWAVATLAGLAGKDSHVIDVACGVGYGTNLLAEAGFLAIGIDREAAAIDYARQHYSTDDTLFMCGDATEMVTTLPGAGIIAAVCFETIEHIENPLPLLQALRARAPRLLASVPNEDEFPFIGYRFHFRHYTPVQFEQLLKRAGWKVREWWGQDGTGSTVEKNMLGRTVIVECEHDEADKVSKFPAGLQAPPHSLPSGIQGDPPTPVVEPVTFPTPEECSNSLKVAPALEQPRGSVLTVPAPGHVAILGLGPSLHAYMDLCRRLGARHKVADETWAINALGDTFQCDRIFHMDDVRIQQIRAAADPEGNIAAMLTWLKTHQGPIYTSQKHPDYPGLVDYPLEDVVANTKFGYFNNTAAYAVAYAIYIGVKKITMFGCDFTYPNAHHSEKGRGCLEFWLGFAAARGIKLSTAKTSSLLDAMEPQKRRYYGYDAVEIQQSRDESGRVLFSFAPRPVLPTAEEIEREYDHSAHPNPLVGET